MLAGLANAGSMPVLEEMMRFTAQRHRLIAHNIANMDTPGFLALDASPASFQAALAEAVEERRDRTGGEGGGLRAFETREVRRGRDGFLVLTPKTPVAGLTGHDRNNADIETLMKDLAENQMAFRVASDLMRKQQDMLRVAMTGRV